MSSDQYDPHCVVSSSTPLPRPFSFIKLRHFKLWVQSGISFLADACFIRDETASTAALLTERISSVSRRNFC